MDREAATTEAVVPHLPVVLVLSRKGGAGKTTVVRALASAAVESDLRTLLIDTDAQQGLAKWGDRASRSGCSTPLMSLLATNSVGDVRTALDDAYDHCKADLAIIDTAGVGLGAIEQLVVEADHLVLPMKLTTSDVESSVQTLAWIKRLAERVDDPEALPTARVVVSDFNPRPTRNDKDVLVEVVKRMPVLATPMTHRDAFITMDREGLLGPILDRLVNGTDKGQRVHAGRFREALNEAQDLLTEICGPLSRRSS